MKTWMIVAIVVVLLIIAVVIYMSMSKKTQAPAPVVVESNNSSNWADFATQALPSIISLFNKPKPVTTGIGGTPPTELAGDNQFSASSYTGVMA